MSRVLPSLGEFAQGMDVPGLSVASFSGGVLRFRHQKEGLEFEVEEFEWAQQHSIGAMGELLRKKLEAARAAKAEEERAKKLAAMGDHERRRAVFYEWEMEAFQKGLVSKPEEPNVRVFARVIAGVMETARHALSSQDFKALALLMTDEMGSIAQEGGQ